MNECLRKTESRREFKLSSEIPVSSKSRLDRTGNSLTRLTNLLMNGCQQHEPTIHETVLLAQLDAREHALGLHWA